MDFVFSKDLGITLDLIALRTDSQPFTIHMCQHEGEFVPTPTKFGNGHNVLHQFEHFFDKARQESSDLVLTPEYSCPWEIVTSLVANPSLWPLPGKLWVISCESIVRSELASLKTQCNLPNVFFHCEEEDPSNNKSFYDPLVYICWCKHKGIDKLLVLVQFKTAHMGARLFTMERDNLIEGNLIWVLKNEGESHSFLSVICSEAMNFATAMTPDKKAKLGWHTNPFYIFHPQANPDPTHKDFIQFRDFVLSAERKEIISLNWNGRSTYGKGQFLKNATSRSGIYTQSHDLDLSDNKIRANHSYGLYYFSFGPKYNAFFLNSYANIFHLRETHILITDAATPQDRKDGPVMLNVESYDKKSGDFSEVGKAIPDEHIAFLTETACGCRFLNDTNACILEKERLICLTCGELKADLSLIEMKTLQTFRMSQDTESNHRITVNDDTRQESNGKKRAFINSLNLLVHDIIPNKTNYPSSIAHLKKHAISIGFSADARIEKYKHNVIGPNGESMKATLLMMESAPDSELKKTFNIVRDLFDSDSPYKGTVVIFYRRGAKYLAWEDPKAASITHTGQHDGANILNDSQ